MLITVGTRVAAQAGCRNKLNGIKGAAGVATPLDLVVSGSGDFRWSLLSFPFIHVSKFAALHFTGNARAWRGPITEKGK